MAAKSIRKYIVLDLPRWTLWAPEGAEPVDAGNEDFGAHFGPPCVWFELDQDNSEVEYQLATLRVSQPIPEGARRIGRAQSGNETVFVYLLAGQP